MEEQQYNQDSWAERAANSLYIKFTTKAQLEVIEQLDDRDLTRFMILQMMQIEHDLAQTKKYAFYIALPIMVSMTIGVAVLLLTILLGANM